MRSAVLLVSLALLLGCPCGGSGGSGGGDGVQPTSCADGSPVADALTFSAAFGGEFFTQPLKLVQHPSDDDRFYVVEKEGTVETLLKSNPAASRALAVDIRDTLTIISNGERGLLGMAFDPGFAVNHEVFFSYTEGASGNFDSVVGRFTSPDGGMTFAPAAAMDLTLVAIDQPASNHNGGDIVFGPDGYLYYGMGDGGGGGDPFENGQDDTTLLGTIMRLDVSVTPAVGPPDNPFAGSGGDDRIFAYGLRNPWRMSFDSMTGELWVGDVGQDDWEEIDQVVSGGNYGWDCYEGFGQFEVDANCQPGPIDPELVHPQPDFSSITGGYVYRGSAIPELQGAYVYGDYVRGEVCAFFFAENPVRVVSLNPPAGLRVPSFAEDRDGELYVIDFSGSPSIYQVVAAP
jgi:glucose/arabinose dehydrogenase